MDNRGSQCVICYNEVVDVVDVIQCSQCQNSVCDDCYGKLLGTPHFRCPMCRKPYIELSKTADRLEQLYLRLISLDRDVGMLVMMKLYCNDNTRDIDSLIEVTNSQIDQVHRDIAIIARNLNSQLVQDRSN
jgi:hypothetical protein